MKSIDRQVVVGTPLMAEESDAKALANTLNDEADIKAALANGIVAFMGHGNPEGYDYYGGNVRYIQLEESLRAISPKYYVGTVDMDETYAEDVLKHIAGGKFDIETKAYETNFTEACWRQYKSGDEYIPGLAERSAVRKLWMNHTTAAIKKLDTDEALSTPTTAAE